MKIKKFKKINKNTYELILDNNEKIIINEELIFKYDLLLTKEVTAEVLKKINQEGLYYEVYDLALNKLNKKRESIYSLTKYLKTKGDDQLVDQVINHLINQKYLDDLDYAKAFVNDKLKFSLDGPLKIKYKLEQEQIDGNTIKEALLSFNNEEELTRITDIINKKIKLNHDSSNKMFKLKVSKYLYGLGYNLDNIKSVVAKISFDDSKIKEQVKERLQKKLSHKYSDSKVEEIITKKLIEQGFN